MRRLLTTILIIMAFAAVATPLWRPELICQREVYRALEATEAISRASGGLWGQIMGRNIPRHPEWMRRSVIGAGTIAMAPLLAVALVLHLRLNTRIGNRRLPVSIKRLGACLALAWFAYAVTAGLLEGWLTTSIQEGAFELGKRLGCQYTAFGYVVIGPEGPFRSAGWGEACNLLWRHGPRVATAVVAFLTALAAFHLFAPWLQRHDGVMRCAKCGYELRGLPGSCCPECGAAAVRPPDIRGTAPAASR